MPKNKLRIPDDQKANYGIIDGPVFPDHCEHGEDAYLCSFKVPPPTPDQPPLRYDLYLFRDDWYGTEVCMRSGSDEGDYFSPGGLSKFLFTAGCHNSELPHYSMAAKIITDFGRCYWEKRIGT